MRMKWFMLATALAVHGTAGLAAGHGPSSPLLAEDKSGTDAVTTRHTLTTSKGRMEYTAKAGTIPLRDGAGAVTARMFYVAYEAPRTQGAPPRPVTFLFNGGPGSSSVWLHMGSFGPVRLKTAAPGLPDHAPRLGPNQHTLLDQTDLVFLDAVGTGFSHASTAENNKDYWGNDQDSASFAQAIETWLTMSGKWDAPKFLFGESYGTMRSAYLANRLESRGISLTGIVMMSTILNFAHFAPDLDQSAVDLLPTFAATALYHGAVAPVSGGVEGIARDAREFARGAYAAALAKGDLVTDQEKHEVAVRMSALTGLSVDYLERAGLRVDIDQFRRELLRTKGVTIGSLDTRYSGAEADGVGERATYDPTEAALAGAYTAAFNHYVVNDLGYQSSSAYAVTNSNTIMGKWDWSHQPPRGSRQGSLADSLPDLSTAMRHNPKIRILALNGWYDLMTPFFATEFDLARLSLGKDNARRVSLRYYPSGHMLYVDERVMDRLHADIADFYRETLGN